MVLSIVPVASRLQIPYTDAVNDTSAHIEICIKLVRATTIRILLGATKFWAAKTNTWSFGAKPLTLNTRVAIMNSCSKGEKSIYRVKPPVFPITFHTL